MIRERDGIHLQAVKRGRVIEDPNTAVYQQHINRVMQKLGNAM